MCAFLKIPLLALTPDREQALGRTIFSYKGHLRQTSGSRGRSQAKLQFEPRGYFCIYRIQLLPWLPFQIHCLEVIKRDLRERSAFSHPRGQVSVSLSRYIDQGLLWWGSGCLTAGDQAWVWTAHFQGSKGFKRSRNPARSFKAGACRALSLPSGRHQGGHQGARFPKTIRATRDNVAGLWIRCVVSIKRQGLIPSPWHGIKTNNSSIKTCPACLL